MRKNEYHYYEENVFQLSTIHTKIIILDKMLNIYKMWKIQVYIDEHSAIYHPYPISLLQISKILATHPQT